MEGAIALDVSSEDSNIATFFQSFDNDGFIINPAKDLSQTFAKIELTIKNPFDFEAQDDLAAKLNRIFNLMVYSIQTTELYPKLEEDFKEYYDKRLNSIFARIFTNELLKILYHLDNDNIDTMWQIHRLVILLYTFVFPELDLRFKIPSETTVVVIKCFQYPLFKYLRTRSDVAMSESMELSTPCEFFRGKILRTFVIKQKLNLMEQCLFTILNSCQLDSQVLFHFQQLLNQSPTYFSIELCSSQMTILRTRVQELSSTRSNNQLKSLCNSIDKTISEVALQAPVPSADQQRSHFPHSTIIWNRRVKDSPLETHFRKPLGNLPNWLEYIQYASRDMTQQNSDYVGPSSKSETWTLTQQVVPHPHEGFRAKVKRAMGITGKKWFAS